MTIECKIRRGWLIRMLIAGVAFLGFGGWALYDGMIGYPAIEENFQAFFEQLTPREYEILQAQVQSPQHRGPVKKTIDGTDYAMKVSREEGVPQLIFINLSKDKEYTVHRQQASENGNEREAAGYYVKSDWDIRTQFIMFVICIVIGGVIIMRSIFAVKKSFAAGDNGVSVNGDKIPYDRIREIDKRKWNSKSIAFIFYEQDGSRKKIKIDDWIYENGENLLVAAENNAPQNIIVHEPKNSLRQERNKQ